MARKKSKLRRAISPRHLRWMASRALISAAPALRRPLNFHGRAISVAAAAERLLFEDAMVVDRPFSAEDVDFIRSSCREHDGPAEPDYWAAPWRFSTAYYLLNDVEMLSHTGCLADVAGRGLISADGAPENWNRDKLALLRAADPIAGTALTVRRYTNYFHFMLEAAMPLVAYFEHADKLDGPHSIVSAPVGPGFARETLKAIAARYGARLVELPKGSKARLENVATYVRRTPCSDWPMARPETAAALRDALLAHFGRQIDPSAGRRLYLRRGASKIRNLRNDDDFTALATEDGFEILEPASANLADQVQRTAEADRILAVHGAALANLIFARPGAALVEVFAQDFCKSVYMMLARQLGLTHFRVVSGPGDYQQNFTADLPKIKSQLQRAA